jgi:protein-tyrosine-phosphatase
MPAKDTIIIVCTANICRSPMAERLLRHALAAEKPPLSRLKVVSSGVAAGIGHAATDHSITAMKKVGIDLSDHSSRPLTQELLDSALAVFCMTETHRALIQISFERVPEHMHLFREFMGKDGETDIPDPYGQSFASYVSSRDSMVEAIPSIVRFLKTIAG